MCVLIVYVDNLNITGFYILSVRIITKYSKKYFLVLVIFHVHIFCTLPSGTLKSAHFPQANTLK